MKKILRLLGVFALTLFVVGCNEELPVEKKNEYNQELFQYLDEQISDEVDSDITLPSEYVFSDNKTCFIFWESSNEKVVSSEGKYTKRMVDSYITLSTTIICDEIEEELSFSKEVFVKGEMTREEYCQLVDSLIPEKVYKDFEFIDREQTYATAGIVGYITYTSSDEAILSSDGKYVTQSPNDETININYQVSIDNVIVEGSKSIIVEGRQDEQLVDNTILWLEETFPQNATILDDLDLPFTDETSKVTISWTSTNPDIINANGIIKQIVKNKEVKLQATLTMNDCTKTWELTMKTFDDDTIVQYILNRMHVSDIWQTEFKAFDGLTVRYTQEDYGYLNFYVQDINSSSLVTTTTANNVNKEYANGYNNTNTSLFSINEAIIPWTSENRTKIMKTSTDYITVHDTGDINFDAARWSQEINTDSRQVSWHFTVDDSSIYQQVPLDEVAWHAGDGSQRFSLVDTNIKYTVENPEIVAGNDGYFYINGIKTELATPRNSGKIVTRITDAGIYTCKGDNGNYYMSGTYYNSQYNCISMGGGNRNSVGIETCINSGVDYNQVMRNTANLVAHLLKLYNLGTDRIMQHRNFSGKTCPQSMIRLDRWNEFLELVELELLILNNCNNLKIEYISNNPTIVNNQGKIIKAVSEDTPITYTVKVTQNGDVSEYTYTTTIHPKA